MASCGRDAAAAGDGILVVAEAWPAACGKEQIESRTTVVVALPYSAAKLTGTLVHRGECDAMVERNEIRCSAGRIYHMHLFIITVV